jgi:hypothetical protein
MRCPHLQTGLTILFSLREIIRKKDQNSCVAFLECSRSFTLQYGTTFVNDAKILAKESNMFSDASGLYTYDMGRQIKSQRD